MSFQGLSEDADGDGWVTKLRGKSIRNASMLENVSQEDVHVKRIVLNVLHTASS